MSFPIIKSEYESTNGWQGEVSRNLKNTRSQGLQTNTQSPNTTFLPGSTLLHSRCCIPTPTEERGVVFSDGFHMSSGDMAEWFASIQGLIREQYYVPGVTVNKWELIFVLPDTKL